MRATRDSSLFGTCLQHQAFVRNEQCKHDLTTEWLLTAGSEDQDIAGLQKDFAMAQTIAPIAPRPHAGDANQADHQERSLGTASSMTGARGTNGFSDRGPQHRYGPSEGSALPELLAAFSGAVVVMALLTIGYWRQGYAEEVSVGQSEMAIPTLMLFTLAAAVIIGGVLLAQFVSKPQNRAVAEKTIGTG